MVVVVVGGCVYGKIDECERAVDVVHRVNVCLVEARRVTPEPKLTIPRRITP